MKFDEDIRSGLDFEPVLSSSLQAEVRNGWPFKEIVGRSAALQRVLRQIEVVPPTDSTVLITEESGTGKELIAHAIHKCSRRSGRPFVSVNCAALAAKLKIPASALEHRIRALNISKIQFGYDRRKHHRNRRQLDVRGRTRATQQKAVAVLDYRRLARGAH
jgi:hypothetical protein